MANFSRISKVSYFTPVALVFLLTYATLVVIAVESILVKSLHDRGPAKALRLDLTCGWAVPLAYTAAIIAVFWLA